jgi:hypothetical protein
MICVNEMDECLFFLLYLGNLVFCLIIVIALLCTL